MRLAAEMRLGAALLVVGLAVGCLGRSPQVRQYTLAPVAGSAASGSFDGLSVAVSPVSLPRYLDRPQIVTRVSASELDVDGSNRWAGGFRSNVTRALIDDLDARLPGASVASSERASSPAFRVDVDVRSFEGHPGGELVLHARWTVTEQGGQKRLWSRAPTIRSRVSGGDVEGLVAAHDAALGELADAIAAQVASAVAAP